jgi:hypothetical protein
MNRLKRLLWNFRRYSVEVLIELARFIIESMTNNAHFTTPDPTLAELKNLTDDLEVKFLKAQTGEHVAHLDMMKARTKLESALRSEVLYVEKIAAGDESILHSSGFPLTGDQNPPQRLYFWVVRGPNSGDILTGRIAYPRARAYVLQYFVGNNPPADPKLWIWAMVSTKTRIGVTGLEKGTTVWFRSCAVTPDGMTPWTDPKPVVVG